MTSEIDWGKLITRRVAAEIKRRRGGNTVQWVADRTAELGYAVSRSRISDIEAGKRGGPIGVAELIVIAEALEMPPLELIYGSSLVTNEVEYLPGKSTTAWGALLRFAGELPSDSDRGYRLRLVRELERIPQRRRDTEAQLAKSIEELEEARRELARHLPFETHDDGSGDLNYLGEIQKGAYQDPVDHAERMVEITQTNLDYLNQREQAIRDELRRAGYVIETREEES